MEPTPVETQGVTPAGRAMAGEPASASATPAVFQDAKRMTDAMHEEYHDPYDDWSARDLALALTPLIITYALQDVAFRAGLLLALIFSGFQVIMRTVTWDSRRKKVWPILDLTSFILFSILYGLSWVNFWQINKWFNVIVPLTFAFNTLVSLLWRRPWTAHYARYPKFDRGGSLLWHRDATWRTYSDIATSAWFIAFSIALLLSLAPVLTGHHHGRHSLNIIFNYVFPYVLFLGALITTQMLGNFYRAKTVRDLDRYYGRQYAGAAPATTGTTATEAYPTETQV